MDKSMEQLINELDIKEPEFTTLYELFTEAGVTSCRWTKVAAFIQKKFKMSSYFDGIKVNSGTDWVIMILAKGYDEGLRDGAKKAKKC